MFKWTFYKEIFLKIHSKTHNMHALIMKFKSTSGEKNNDQTKHAINSWGISSYTDRMPVYHSD